MMKQLSTFEQIESEFKEIKGTFADDQGEYSAEIVKDINVALAIMDNIRTGAINRAILYTPSVKLKEYIGRIKDKIRKNQKSIDNKYKNEIKESVERICKENNIEFKFTTSEELEEAVNEIKSSIDYDPYKELFNSTIIKEDKSKKDNASMMEELIAKLQAKKEEYDSDKTPYYAYRDVYGSLAAAFKEVEEKRNKQKGIIKHLGLEFLLNISQGPLRDKIKSLVTADSELYRHAYTVAYGTDGFRAAEDEGLFSAEKPIEVDIVTKFLLRDTGIEERIVDSYKAKALTDNRFIKNNGYDKVKAFLPALEQLIEESKKLDYVKDLKTKKLAERLENLPDLDDTEGQKKYIQHFTAEKDYDKEYNENVIAASDLSSYLGKDDGKNHLLKEQFRKSTEDFDNVAEAYSNFVKYKEQFGNCVSDFHNPEINTLLQERNKLLENIDNLSYELDKLSAQINELNADKETLVPENAGFFTKFWNNMTQRNDLKQLNTKLNSKQEEYTAKYNELNNKKNYILPNINNNLVELFKKQMAVYLGLFKDWNILIDLDFVLNYDPETLIEYYNQDIELAKEEYQKRIKFVLDDLAEKSDTDPERIYVIAKRNGISIEEPSAIATGALDNLFMYLYNFGKMDSITNKGVLDKVKELCEADVSIDEVSFDKIFNKRLNSMDSEIVDSDFTYVEEQVAEVPVEDEVEVVSEEEVNTSIEENNEETVSLDDTIEFPIPVSALNTTDDKESISEDTTPETLVDIEPTAVTDDELLGVSDIEDIQGLLYEDPVPSEDEKLEVFEPLDPQKISTAAKEAIETSFGDDDDDDYTADLYAVLEAQKKASPIPHEVFDFDKAPIEPNLGGQGRKLKLKP